MHIYDVVKYVYCFEIPFINSICIGPLWKVSYTVVIVSTLPGPKYSRFMDMLFFSDSLDWLSLPVTLKKSFLHIVLYHTPKEVSSSLLT